MLTRLAAASALVAVSGCSLLQPGFPSRAPAEAAPPITFEAEPSTAHVFEITDPEQTVYGEVQVIEARDEDTFSDIARSYGLGYDELVHANPEVDPWLPGEGTRIVLPTRFVLPDAPQEGIVLNIAAKRLFAFRAATEDTPATVTTYPIGIGRVGWATPTGEATVIAKATDPAWYVPASVRAEHAAMGDPLPSIVPPGPDNPLGRHVLKLDMPGYLLHGTNQPYGVGMRVSHGCVRLYPEDIEVLYSVTGMGTKVTIVNEPVSVGVRDGVHWIVLHPQLEDDERDWMTLFAAATKGLETEGEAEPMLEPDGLARAWRSPVPLQPRYVANVAAPPADAPDRETVARLLDELLEEGEAESEPEAAN